MCQSCGCTPCEKCGRPIEDGVCAGCGKPPSECTCERCCEPEEKWFLLTLDGVSLHLTVPWVKAVGTAFSQVALPATDFEVDGTPLAYGDKLSNFGTLATNPKGQDYYTGTITGTLADGSALNNNTFVIYNTGDFAGTGDIILTPEPAFKRKSPKARKLNKSFANCPECSFKNFTFPKRGVLLIFFTPVPKCEITKLYKPCVFGRESEDWGLNKWSHTAVDHMYYRSVVKRQMTLL